MLYRHIVSGAKWFYKGNVFSPLFPGPQRNCLDKPSMFTLCKSYAAEPQHILVTFSNLHNSVFSWESKRISFSVYFLSCVLIPPMSHHQLPEPLLNASKHTMVLWAPSFEEDSSSWTGELCSSGLGSWPSSWDFSCFFSGQNPWLCKSFTSPCLV